MCNFSICSRCKHIFMCFEMFSISRSIIRFISENSFMPYMKFSITLLGNKMTLITIDFKWWCNLPSAYGVIDITHLRIPKPFGPIVTNYYYHKSKGALFGVAIVIDLNKQHLYVVIGLSWSVNDLWTFTWFSLYRKVQYNGLFNAQLVPCENNIPLWFLDNKRYLLLIVNVINPRVLLERLSCM
jgi:hypothetical protein